MLLFFSYENTTLSTPRFRLTVTWSDDATTVLNYEGTDGLDGTQVMHLLSNGRAIKSIRFEQFANEPADQIAVRGLLFGSQEHPFAATPGNLLDPVWMNVGMQLGLGLTVGDFTDNSDAIAPCALWTSGNGVMRWRRSAAGTVRHVVAKFPLALSLKPGDYALDFILSVAMTAFSIRLLPEPPKALVGSLFAHAKMIAPEANDVVFATYNGVATSRATAIVHVPVHIERIYGVYISVTTASLEFLSVLRARLTPLADDAETGARAYAAALVNTRR
jgi:hypothetical protein